MHITFNYNKMKTWILAMTMTMMGLTLNAQEKRERPAPLTTEQRAELQAKRMTLALDLNEQQQKEVGKLLLEKGKQKQALRKQYMANRKAGKKMTADERFAMKSHILDEKIKMKEAMQQILTPEQLNKFAKMKEQRKEKITKHNKKIKMYRRR